MGSLLSRLRALEAKVCLEIYLRCSASHFVWQLSPNSDLGIEIRSMAKACVGSGRSDTRGALILALSSLQNAAQEVINMVLCMACTKRSNVRLNRNSRRAIVLQK